MSRRAIRSGVAALLLALIPGSSPGPSRPQVALAPGVRAFGPGPASLADSRLQAIRIASVGWEGRTGPDRRVVDVVCLVPDLPTFLEAISAWDDHHVFPILFDDANLSLKFLRAFRPSRVVRPPGRASPIGEGGTWELAVAAVGRSWTRKSRRDGTELPGDIVPRRLGPTPPGIVVSAPDSPALAGAVALAAGRFQPLLRWEPTQGFASRIERTEAQQLAEELGARVADRIPHEERLGDDCDFVTLAGDYPYRYKTESGTNAFDDLVGRSSRTGRRWAYAGRLLGPAATSAYQAMCSLFLQPESALLFNTYSESAAGGVWSFYQMRSAADQLAPLFPLRHRVGRSQTDIAGWHRVFDPLNRSGLVLLNSSGYPDRFQLHGGWGMSADIPPSIPSVVVPIHSHSAADPLDPDTMAGRWLANGAFLYYGAISEPYLLAFRTPTLIASLISDRLPLAAAVRQVESESFGFPWRLVYLGDPFYRITPAGPRRPRLAWSHVADWPTVEVPDLSKPLASDEERLDWAHRALIVSTVRAKPTVSPSEVTTVLLSIRRERLSPRRMRLLDDLLGDRLDQSPADATLRSFLDRIPAGALTPSLRRRLETHRVADLHRSLAEGDLVAAGRVWDTLVRSGSSREICDEMTARVGSLADTRERLAAWRAQLRTTRSGARSTPAEAVIEEELRRVDAALAP